MPIQTVNPATGKVIRDFNEIGKEELFSIIEKSDNEFQNWKRVSIKERAALMLNAAKVLRENKNEYAEVMTLEMGKVISESVSEIEKCAWVCEYYAENAESILANEYIKSDASESYVRFDPIGIVLAVMPWNFPFWQVFRFAAPALTAGNVGLLKHASNVPMCALKIEEVFQKAGFPAYAFKTLMIGSGLVKDVIDHPLVKAATLTGSEFAGKKVAEACGSKLKKTVMELGGSDPFIILEDADLEEAANVGVKARMINNGQSCIAAKRFIVVESVYEDFQKKFIEHMKKIKVGDPMNEETDAGPMAREDLLNELHDQIEKSVKAGAKILLGGKRMDLPGSFYEPTVISDVKPGMPAYEEELFGPAASFIRARNTEDAVRIANDSDFGLGASLWTRNLELAKKIASQIESGAVFINGLVKSDPRLPFGGVKISGYGRELSHYGIKEFVNIKTVWIK